MSVVATEPDDLPEKMYSSVKVAELFDVTPETVGDWIKQGKLPGSEKINGRFRIPHSAVIALAKGRHG